MLPVEEECNPLNWWRGHQRDTEVLDITEAEEATNSEAESVLLGKAKRDFLFTSNNFLKSPLKPLVEAEISEG